MNLQNFYSIQWNLPDPTQSKLLSALIIMPGIRFMNQCLHFHLAFSLLKWKEMSMWPEKTLALNPIWFSSYSIMKNIPGFNLIFPWDGHVEIFPLFFKEYEWKPTQTNGNVSIRLTRLWIRLPTMFLRTAIFATDIWKPSWVYPHHYIQD